MNLEKNIYKFHHKEVSKNPTSKGISRLKKEILQKTPEYGSYIVDENSFEKLPKKHKKNKERPRC